MKKTFLTLLLALSPFALFAEKPNIVFVITDDQGYGDLACTGNPVIKTPNIDKLAGESSALTDYHVAPTCSPTRCSLLTGHWTNRTGVWHTINGRSMLRANEITLGQLLKDDGYQTGMFGKWHLGDNYPYRPEDRGFTEVYRHGGGGVGQTPDLWDNSYFDGSYFHNGKIVPAKGFCTDVFFEQGNHFIKECAEQKKPFFAYIALNAPHGPLHAPQNYMDMYADQTPGIAAFFGMITNIDDNVGKTRELIKSLGIYDNTIFIFTTDNGTASGANVYNAGMRGKKGSAYDGGHRVPFFLHWPAGKMNKKHEDGTLTHAIDIVPTLLNMVGAKKPANLNFDGTSIKDLLDPNTDVEWPDRYIITDSQRVRDPIKWRESAVMSQQYRLVNGKQLYDIKADPGQEKNIAADLPDIVKNHRDFYEAWWTELEPTFAQTTEIYLGHPDHPSVTLTSHDWIQDQMPPWNQASIRQGLANKNKKHEGHWAVKVITNGNYKISLRRWPAESDQAITAALPAGEKVPGASKAFRETPGRAIATIKATLRINDKVIETIPIPEGAKEVSFTTELSAGSHQLSPVFITEKEEIGAFYTIVEKLP
jgi:arylsulfatase A-like enzyme